MTEVVRTATRTQIDKNTILVVWTELDGDDSGKAEDFSGYPDKTVHVYGTFGIGPPTITLYGSNDPAVVTDRVAGTLYGSKTASWIAAQDSLGNNFAKTAEGGDVIVDAYRYYLPVVTGGTGTTVTVSIMATRSRI